MGESGLRISFTEGEREHAEERRVDKIPPGGEALRAAAYAQAPLPVNRRFVDIGVGFSQKIGERARDVQARPFPFVARVDDAVEPIDVGMEPVVARFMPDPDQGQNRAGQAHGQPGDADQRIGFLPFKVANRNFENILKHRSSPHFRRLSVNRSSGSDKSPGIRRPDSSS